MTPIYNEDMSYNSHANRLDTILMREGMHCVNDYIKRHNLDVAQVSHLLLSILGSSAAQLTLHKRLGLFE